MEPLSNSRYIAVLYKRSEKEVPDFAFGIYDLAKDKIVRQANLVGIINAHFNISDIDAPR